ncbi:hypothetical protein GQ607_017501 [Colletotrichum asianum]|nr:hypothetical protein GQ607_017501 [Colletotrichum asianum]
MCLSYH